MSDQTRATDILANIQRERERTPETAITAWWIERTDCGGKVFAGVTAEEVASALKHELQTDIDEGLTPDEMSVFKIVPYETSQAEIDALPDFEGWI
jgi:hypothetical protein